MSVMRRIRMRIGMTMVMMMEMMMMMMMRRMTMRMMTMMMVMMLMMLMMLMIVTARVRHRTRSWSCIRIWCHRAEPRSLVLVNDSLQLCFFRRWHGKLIECITQGFYSIIVVSTVGICILRGSILWNCDSFDFKLGSCFCFELFESEQIFSCHGGLSNWTPLIFPFQKGRP